MDYLVHHYRISERRACKLVEQHRSTQRYAGMGSEEDSLAFTADGMGEPSGSVHVADPSREAGAFRTDVPGRYGPDRSPFRVRPSRALRSVPGQGLEEVAGADVADIGFESTGRSGGAGVAGLPDDLVASDQIDVRLGHETVGGTDQVRDIDDLADFEAPADAEDTEQPEPVWPPVPGDPIRRLVERAEADEVERAEADEVERTELLGEVAAFGIEPDRADLELLEDLEDVEVAEVRGEVADEFEEFDGDDESDEDDWVYDGDTDLVGHRRGEAPPPPVVDRTGPLRIPGPVARGLAVSPERPTRLVDARERPESPPPGGRSGAAGTPADALKLPVQVVGGAARLAVGTGAACVASAYSVASYVVRTLCPLSRRRDR